MKSILPKPFIPSVAPSFLHSLIFPLHDDHGDEYLDEDGYDAINAINTNDEDFGKGFKAKTKCGGHFASVLIPFG